MPSPQLRSFVRIAGALCLTGAVLSTLGMFLIWYHVSTISRDRPVGVGLNAPINFDIFQMPYARESALAIAIGAATLGIIGFVALTLSSRRLPLMLGSIMATAAAVAIASGIVAAHPWMNTFSSASRGPGASVSLLGPGLGLLAVLVVYVGWRRRAREDPLRPAADSRYSSAPA
jgi:hypothetical protein